MPLAFRQRIFAWLVVIAVVPAGIAVLAAVLAPRVAAPVGGVAAWERAAESWRGARRVIEGTALSPAERASLERHEDELSLSLQRARQAQTIRSAFSGLLAAAALALAVLVGGGAVRLAGHLARQLSRPIDELVQWTGLLQRGESLPDTPAARGAPEFDVLRDAIRRAAAELQRARQREVEAAELRAFREMARQVAHELKNPLTPIRLAIARLAREAGPGQQELIAVLDAESARLEQMARDFADLGRLPEGPPAVVDLGELCDAVARAGAPDGVEIRVEHRGPARVLGHYEPLRRAVHNLVLNAIDAVRWRSAGGEVLLDAGPAEDAAPGEPAASAVNGGGARLVTLRVRDNGTGIAPDALPRLFEPYFTTKSQGTGLGLALVRQTVHLHGGTIGVRSQPGRTEFVITLPEAAAG